MQIDVLESLNIQHPITYDTYNLCELYAKKSLKNLKVNVLQDICSSLDIDTSDVKARRKQPYIDLIASLVSMCTCQSNA